MNADGSELHARRERVAHWFHQHGPLVRGYVLAMVRDTHVADDILQEVFRKAWEAQKRYREAGSARAYLLRIADRLLCDRGRRLRRENATMDVDLDNQQDHGNASPTEQVLLSEQRQRLAEVLRELSPLQQRVLLLRYYGDMSFADIAETVGCPLSTALSHARRGLQTLRKRFAEVV
jgi:RNA polymerase sigma-70 factor (ECF subfamily)